MKHVLMGLVFTSLFAFSKPSRAYTQECSWCSSPQVFESLAKSFGTGQHTLFNLDSNVVHTYRVQEKRGVQPTLDPDPFLLDAIEIQTPSDILYAIETAKGVYTATGGSMRAFADISYTEVPILGLNERTTSYDVVNDSNLRARLGDTIATNIRLFGATKIFANNIFSILQAKIGLKTTPVSEVTVIFSDGSKVTYAYSFTEGTGTAKYLEGRSRTAKNQLVPERGAPGGKWYGLPGGGDDMGKFGQFIQGGGGTIDWIPTSPSPVQAVVCTPKPGSEGFICSYQIANP